MHMPRGWLYHKEKEKTTQGLIDCTCLEMGMGMSLQDLSVAQLPSLVCSATALFSDLT